MRVIFETGAVYFMCLTQFFWGKAEKKHNVLAANPKRLTGVKPFP